MERIRQDALRDNKGKGSWMKERRRIMLIVPMLHQGGFERICAMTAKLLNQEHEVHLVVFSTEDMIYDVSGVDLIDLNLGVVSGKIGKLLNVWKRVLKVRSLKKKLKIQVSYSFGTTANLVNVLSKYKDITWAGIRGYGALEEHLELIAGKADRVVSCTGIMERDITKRCHVKSSAVLYNPCDVNQIKELSQASLPEEFALFFDKPGKIVVSMGREDDVKGFWHLIKSVYLVKKQISDVKLMIIGEGEYAEYKQLALDLGMKDDVLFTGVHKNPFALLNKADVYALTSDSEGFPNALIEAMALGIPCISVNCKTGPAEILHKEYEKCYNPEETYYADYGVLMPILKGKKDVSPDSFTVEEEQFAKELEKLLKDESFYQNYADKAYERANIFSIAAYKDSIELLIQEDAERCDY